MIEVKITSKNRVIIENILIAVQSKSNVRTLNYDDLEHAAGLAEELLDKIISKQKRQNVRAIVKPFYEPMSCNYRGVPTHTESTIRRGSDGWYISDVSRKVADRSGSQKVSIVVDSLREKVDNIFSYVTRELIASS
ncbi:hypothetical protein AN214_03105 [Pseudoalteromonas sp. P1-9]|uniref:hypothetical protein n=1 Tax=Pseudoalteromonas sp. P1-9 TaxID=1710354 RepID=UPI0006D627AD|nr:hypothetical protein [Pseudoalteromonas sp. P1-9]KPV94804.1 hypothetical protein AN214_03105 [Pseudoalteromonas sp. P1-9]